MERRQKTETGRDGVRWLRTFAFLVLPVMALLILGGCSKEFEEVSDNPAKGQLTEITLSPESMGDVAMDTRAVSGVDENKISDLWVIQLNSAGTEMLLFPQYVTSVTGSGTSYTAKAKIKAAPSHIYFIANTHNSTLYNDATTSALVAAKTLAVTNEASIASGTLPMVGYFSGTPTAENLKNISLKRAVAKLTFKLAADIQNGGSFVLKSVKVCNVPKVLHPYRDPSKLDPGTNALICYPATTAGVNGEFTDITPSDKTLSATAKECGWCYLPENGRGTGTATDQKDKTAATALGGATGQGNYATYVDVRGNYKNLINETFDVSYRIYLGSDAISNYDVKRNTHYTVTATIKGLNEFDARIELNGATLAIEYYDYTDNMTGWFVYARTDASTSGMTWQNAQLECIKTSGWRLPSITELWLMSCLRDSWTWGGGNNFMRGCYWSATGTSSKNALAAELVEEWGSYWEQYKGYSNLVRCVRGL